MYSGGDSSGEGINSLNHFAQFQLQAATTGGDNIDWATLAQQWIQMRDSLDPTATNLTNFCGYNQVAVQPTSINHGAIHQQSKNIATFAVEEKGEADMDMDDDDEDAVNSTKPNIAKQKRDSGNDSPPPPPPSMQLGSGMQPHWFVNAQKPLVADNLDIAYNPQPASLGVWNAWQTSANVSTPAVAPVIPSHPPNNPTAHIPSLLNLNVINPNESKEVHSSPTTDNCPISGVDAAKRKKLPAWIREGLEKMEREKQKQVERERQLQNENPNKLSKWETIDENELKVNHSKDTVNIVNPVTDEMYSSGNEDDDQNILVNIKAASVISVGKDANNDIGSARAVEDEEISTRKCNKSGKTYEQKISELMFVVRRSLTELLLEVTNEEISKIANETIRSRKTKASSAQVIRKSALSSITGKLGLAAYADSSSESDESDAVSDVDDKAANNDSEEELKMEIRNKRHAFSKIAEEIEKEIADAAEREDKKLKHYTSLENDANKMKEQSPSQTDDHTNNNSSNNKNTQSMKFSKSFSKDFGEPTESKIHHYNGAKRRNRNERTTRFSDNKDTKTIVAANAAAAAVTSHFLSQTAADKQQLSSDSTKLLQLTTVNLDDTKQKSQLLNRISAKKQQNGLNDVLSAAELATEKSSTSKMLTAGSKKHLKERLYSSDNYHRTNDSYSSDSSTGTDSSSSSRNSSKYSRYSGKSRKYERRSKERENRYGSSTYSIESKKSYSSRKDNNRTEDHYHKYYKNNGCNRKRKHSRYDSSDSDNFTERKKNRDSSYNFKTYSKEVSKTKSSASRRHRSRSKHTRSRSRSKSSRRSYASSSGHYQKKK